MSATKVPYGRPIKLLIDFQGFTDGRPVQFEIWRKRKQSEDEITQLNGVTRGGKAHAVWNPDFGEYSVELKANEREIQVEVEEEKYYFIAKIDDKEAKSGDLEFIYPLDIYLEDENGCPLNNVEYTLTLSDGSQRQGKFSAGHARLGGIPLGRFKVGVKGYSPDTLYGAVQ